MIRRTSTRADRADLLKSRSQNTGLPLRGLLMCTVCVACAFALCIGASACSVGGQKEDVPENDMAVEQEPTLAQDVPVKLDAPLFEFYQNAELIAFAENFSTTPPTSLTIALDDDGRVREYPFTESEQLQRVFAALKQVNVEREIDKKIDPDDDVFFTFVMGDGSSWVIHFNDDYLEYENGLYKVSNADALWNIVEEYCPES